MGLVALMATACTKSKEAAVTATIEGGAQQEIVVAKLAVSQMRIVDTLKADAQGVAKGKIVLSENAPEFYYLVCNGNRVASLILKPGDKVSVKADTLGNGLVIEGSEESVLLQKYQEGLAAVNREYTAITSKLLDAVETSDTKLAQQVSQQLNKLYLKYRQSVTKMIMENPYSFANVQAIYQSIGNEPPLFSADNDYLLVQRVHDSLAVKYPNSVYLKSLQSDIKARQNALILAEKISKAEESSYPNLILPDINAKSVELQSLKGRPFILMFWTISEASQKMLNNDLKELYKKYSKNAVFLFFVKLCIIITISSSFKSVFSSFGLLRETKDTVPIIPASHIPGPRSFCKNLPNPPFILLTACPSSWNPEIDAKFLLRRISFVLGTKQALSPAPISVPGTL